MAGKEDKKVYIPKPNNPKPLLLRERPAKDDACHHSATRILNMVPTKKVDKTPYELWYRLNVEKVEWIIYLTDVGQKDHFHMFFNAAKCAGWLSNEEGEYPKTSSRIWDAVWTDEQLEQTAEALGYGAVKYADLKNNRLTNYKFNYDQMLSDKAMNLNLTRTSESESDA
ncbi:arginine--tRNA ligase, cytoplasmic-like protein [Tanacetum coccineum]|uniref:Arginine--tRNA ligase, cytoplasmic-like protein n=1 Tax=Tanacetum coccineum TaxID=301880 RepID=A0ABQ5DJI7_9ASTR